jgi:peptidoglycan/xylan/chitin deacetylase (PgdA/CDA1 family)
MLNFRNTSIAIILLLLLSWITGMSWYVFVIILFIYSLLLFWGSYRVDSQFYLTTINNGRPGKKQIALSFDDGPAISCTAAILDVLKQKTAPAAFFCIGKNIPGNELLLERIHSEGHIIGNHSYSHHPLFDLYAASRMEQDLLQMNSEVKRVIGVVPCFFRPPYGVTNPNLAKAVKNTRMKAIGWNIRSMDTVSRNEEKLFRQLIRSLQPGAIILFHDTVTATLNILPAFIEEIRRKGFEIVRLDQLINEKPYE